MYIGDYLESLRIFDSLMDNVLLTVDTLSFTHQDIGQSRGRFARDGQPTA